MEQPIIQNIRNRKDLISVSAKNNAYECFTIGKYHKIRLDFRKSFELGHSVGYHHLELSISPHYHFNGYLHNGNDFSFQNCKDSTHQILHFLEISPEDYHLLKVVNIEFGVNIVPDYPVEALMNAILFYHKTPFINRHSFEHYKITDATSYKQIKAYAKGLHFIEFPEYNIDKNTFRFEVKSKQSKNIKKHGIFTADDLFKDEVYKTLSEAVIREWDSVLVIDQNPKLSGLTAKEKQFLKNHQTVEYWQKIILSQNRNLYCRDCKKYNRIMKKTYSVKDHISGLIQDKILSLKSGADSKQEINDQKNPVNLITKEDSYSLEKQKVVQIPPRACVINLEFAPLIPK